MKKSGTKIILDVIRVAIICSVLFLMQFNIIAQKRTLIFPIPQKMEVSDDFFTLDESTSIIVPTAMGKNDIFLARFLVRELSDKYNLALKIEPCENIPKDRKVIIMGRFDNALIQGYCKANNLEVSLEDPGPEGYLLQVNRDRITIAGSDDCGAFYGLQSLRQLINDGNGIKVHGLNVRDWPGFPFRAVKLYAPGSENITFFKRFLRDFMSLYKYNKVIIEFTNMRLDRHPEINAGWIEFTKYMQYSRSNSILGKNGEYKNSSHFDAGDGLIIEKSDVKEIVDCANENYIEVIPELSSLTHSYYLLTRHPELAEYVGDKWPSTYCPSNPDTYKLLFDVFDEYIEIVKPKIIHIGHDEWWGAPLGVCQFCKGKDFSVLFASDINKIHDFLGAKGIKIAMWGDYLLESVRGSGPQLRTSTTGIKYHTPGGTRPEVVRDSIPKDILVLNWFWNSEKGETELQKFGFKQIYGNLTPNISNWDERTKKFNLLGGAPSSWASTNEYNLGKDLMFDFLGCANLIWSGHSINQKDLALITSELMPYIRSSLNTSRIPSKDGDMVETVNISAFCNLSKKSKIFNLNLQRLKAGPVENQGVAFSLVRSSNTSDNCIIAVGTIGEGGNLLPSKVEGIQINEDVSSLVFLHACAVPSENNKAYFNIPDFFDTADILGWYEIVWEDGFREIVPIQYGVNILEYNPGGEDRFEKKEGDTGDAQDVYSYQADPVSCSSDSVKNPITFFAYEWVNKRFGKKIKEVNIHGTEYYKTLIQEKLTKPMKSNAIMLAGITKVKKRMSLLLN